MGKNKNKLESIQTLLFMWSSDVLIGLKVTYILLLDGLKASLHPGRI